MHALAQTILLADISSSCKHFFLLVTSFSLLLPIFGVSLHIQHGHGVHCNLIILIIFVFVCDQNTVIENFQNRSTMCKQFLLINNFHNYKYLHKNQLPSQFSQSQLQYQLHLLHRQDHYHIIGYRCILELSYFSELQLFMLNNEYGEGFYSVQTLQGIIGS